MMRSCVFILFLFCVGNFGDIQIAFAEGVIHAEVPKSSLQFGENKSSQTTLQSVSILTSTWVPAGLQMESQLQGSTEFSSSDLIFGYSSGVGVSYQRLLSQSDEWQVFGGVSGVVSRISRQGNRNITGVNELVSQDVNLYQIGGHFSFERSNRLKKVFFPYAHAGVSPLWIQAKSSQFNRNGISEIHYMALLGGGIGMDVQNYSVLVGLSRSNELSGSSGIEATGIDIGFRYNWNN